MSMTLDIAAKTWLLKEPFAISREVKDRAKTLIVTLIDSEGRRGRGEASGVPYAGETTRTMTAQIEAVRSAIEAGIDREELLALMPVGGARFAIDSALWDLEAKRLGRSVFDLAGLAGARAVDTAYTIGIRSEAAYQTAAEAHAAHEVLKIKVGFDDPLPLIAAARRGAPDSAFIVDPNQAWTVERVREFAPKLADLGVVLLEQPIPVGAEAGLDGYDCPIRLCADELIQDAGDLHKARGRFDVINIKLDKTGGLTEGLRLADTAREQGFALMVGCMGGSSLSMAPGVVLAQQCDFVDLDGPLLSAEDWPDGLVYRNGRIESAQPGFWG